MNTRKFNLLSAAAAVLTGGASASASAPEPTPTPAPVEGEEGEEGDQGGPAKTDAPADGGEPTTTEGTDAAVAVDVVLASDATAAISAERTRCCNVFASAEGIANPGLAAFMLQNVPGASAETIIAQLKTQPGTGTAAAAPAGIPDTNVDLGRGSAASVVEQGGADASAEDVWAASDERVGRINGSTTARSDAGGFVTSRVTTPGASQPVAPVRATGN